MDIDLTLLHSKNVEEIVLDNTYSIPKDYYENSSVLKIENIKVTGRIYQDEVEDIDYIDCHIVGNIGIEDSISLEEVLYPIDINYDDVLPENCKKSENMLDIFQFLWENIVLEVPLHYTKVDDLSKFKGDGWKLISEEDSTNTPFADLLKDFKEE